MLLIEAKYAYKTQAEADKHLKEMEKKGFELKDAYKSMNQKYIIHYYVNKKF